MHPTPDQHPEEHPTVKLRISIIGAIILKDDKNAIILFDGSEVEIPANGNCEETQLRRRDPISDKNSAEFSDEQLKEGISEEIKSLR